ncbi:MAG: methyltransferase domain-containing protein [Actinomycetota bacterium]|nr:methyltransferase domain-containing protein [Actinomycetota bacterium]
MDFGCGGGIDVILSAHKIGSQGRVVGIDFARQMIERAKQAVIEGQWLVVRARNSHPPPRKRILLSCKGK